MWIDINEQLPEDGKTVLALERRVTDKTVWEPQFRRHRKVGEEVTFHLYENAWYSSKHKGFRHFAVVGAVGEGSWTQNCSLPGVTHWFPIPPNPFTGKDF